jgi:hypothetical protein
MNTDAQFFWIATTLCTSAIVAIEAVLGYMKRSWYYKFGIPLPFNVSTIRQRGEIVSTQSFYVGNVGTQEIVIRYRFLGNYAPSLLKAIIRYPDQSLADCRVTLNWWFTFLFSASCLGVFLHGGLKVLFLLSALAAAIAIAQLQGLRAYLEER